MISLLRMESRLPVGSSARRTAGDVAIARAMAHALLLPSGELSACACVLPPGKATASSASRATSRLRDGECPCTEGAARRSPAPTSAEQVKPWKTKPR
jgi:hypothetical protein